ncbi:13788_t:CDS:2 [Funneliformis caledonium]|uniref:13788_t:CDS:1 n=1 Tax=Funneliformis caledonium TaxID=1117310 RepID=A0A9N9D5X3_9GLOM|nr:13788_t:CDS:2 [Funneliformis caledonium]
MTYYNSCIYAASRLKLNKNKITVSDAELEKVHIDRLIAHLLDDNSLCWNEDFIPYERSVQEKIKAKVFEPTFAKYMLDFKKIQKCIACKAFPKYFPSGLCRYHDFCLKFRLHQEFPNKQYIPSLQNSETNLSTLYNVLDTKSFEIYKRW